MKKVNINQPFFSCRTITPQVINLIYREPEDQLGQYVAAICLEASAEELRKFFTELRAQMAEELAHILCNETQLYRSKKFTIEHKTKESFDLFRNGVFLRKCTRWLPSCTILEPPKEFIPKQTFQSILHKHGITRFLCTSYHVSLN